MLACMCWAANTRGAIFSWDIAEVAPQHKERHSREFYDDDEDDESDDEASDSDDEPPFKGDLDWRDSDGCDVEVSRGIPPQAVYRLQQPEGFKAISFTCLLNSSAADKTLVTACSALARDDLVLAYDRHTQQVKNLFLGHMFGIEDIAAAPEVWPGAENLFATAARSGDVKVWDVRLRGGAAAITLTAATDPLVAVALASNRGSTSASSSQAATSASSRNNQLGAGMLCFAGGVGECVWAWDLRNGNAQALYQLSTGNLQVQELAWHEGSSSLIASCDSPYQNRHGECYRDDFMKVGEKDKTATQFLTLFGGLMGGASGLAGLLGLGGGPGGADSEDDGEDSSDSEGGGASPETRWWPRRAKHKSEDFRKHMSLGHSCVLAYTFSERASQDIPPSQEPYFTGYY